ncbi:MAG: O-antigen ligase family protein [Bacteroidaceae bacterium]|nr:O-antigen ligase family protein [Bacteroidaceae bacterium]
MSEYENTYKEEEEEEEEESPKKKKSLLSMGGTPGYMLLAYPFIYLIFSRRRDTADAYATIDLSAMVFIIYSFICMLVGLVSISNSNKERDENGEIIEKDDDNDEDDPKPSFPYLVLFKSPLKWFLAYTALGLISCLWSVNLALTIYRAIECFAMTIVMVATLNELLKSKDVNIAIQWSLWFVFIYILVRIFSYLRWTHDIDIILQACQMIATAFFFLALYHAKQWYIKLTILIFSIFAGSTVAWIGIAAGFIGLAYGNAKKKSLLFTAIAIIVVAATMMGGKAFLKKTIFYDKEGVGAQYTSGRDKIYEYSFASAKKKPILGYGFVSGETDLIKHQWHRTGVISTHDGFLSALLGEGIIGVIFLALFFIQVFIASKNKHIPVKYKPALIGTAIFGFFESIGNPGIGTRVFGAWISVMFTYILICSFYVYYTKDIDEDEDLDEIEDENDEDEDD